MSCALQLTRTRRRRGAGDNREEWQEAVLHFYLLRSVERQRNSIWQGFSKVLPITLLRDLQVPAPPSPPVPL